MSNGSNVPALAPDFVSRMMSGIADSQQKTLIKGGKPFFKLSTEGEFQFGQGNEEVQPGSRWACNIMSFQHGFSCWVDNELVGELMVSMTSSLPVRPEPVMGRPYGDQRSFEMKCLDGDDAGKEVIYKINSIGGIRATVGLMNAIYEQLATNPAYPCPVLTFTADNYHNKKYNKKIWFPIFTIVGWCDMAGNLQGAKAAAVAAKPAEKPAEPAAPPPPPAPARKRKAPLTQAAPPPDLTVAAPPVAPAAPTGPAVTAQGHVGQRRRPTAA